MRRSWEAWDGSSEVRNRRDPCKSCAARAICVGLTTKDHNRPSSSLFSATSRKAIRARKCILYPMFRFSYAGNGFLHRKLPMRSFAVWGYWCCMGFETDADRCLRMRNVECDAALEVNVGWLEGRSCSQAAIPYSICKGDWSLWIRANRYSLIWSLTGANPLGTIRGSVDEITYYLLPTYLRKGLGKV